VAITSLRDDFTDPWQGLLSSSQGSVYQEIDFEGTSFALFIVQHLMPRVLGTVREGYAEFIPKWRDALLAHILDADEYDAETVSFHQRTLPLETVMGACGCVFALLQSVGGGGGGVVWRRGVGVGGGGGGG
jgi:hypothetical protein